MSRAGQVFYQDKLAGIITESEEGYSFHYDSFYLQSPDSQAISLILPVKAEPYFSKILFPFFDGLIPEGWLLDIATENWNKSTRNRLLEV